MTCAEPGDQHEEGRATPPPQGDGSGEGGSRPRRRRRRKRTSERQAPPPETPPADAAPPEATGTERTPPVDRPERRAAGRKPPSGAPSRSRPQSASGKGDPVEKTVERPPSARPKTAFVQFDVPERLLDGIAAAGYFEPTEVQAKMIPLGLQGYDVVARSRTGTGKTCAFLVPALAGLDEIREGDPAAQPQGPVRVLVVVPTRELAMQVAGESERLARYLPVHTACVYGGTRLQRQMRQIPWSAVVVGTPGRLLDHMGRRTFDARTVDVLVLDEVDRMYDLGFRDDVDRIINACSERKQTLLVSATLNEDVERLVAKHVGEYELIEIESKTLTVDEVDQRFYVVVPDRKRELLIALLHERKPDRTIVFCRTRFTADRVAHALSRQGFNAHEIHSGLVQSKRERILSRFRKGHLDLLVATDVAARGLDIQGVDHVVNYDIPENAEDYVHRVGRTARMGEEGWAITLVTPDDGAYLTAIEKLINRQIEQERFPGFEIKPPAPPPDEKAPRAAERPSGIPRWANPSRRRRR